MESIMQSRMVTMRLDGCQNHRADARENSQKWLSLQLRGGAVDSHRLGSKRLASEKNYFVAERPRSPMATRGTIHAGRGTSPSMERDAGSHSVDRIVRIILCLLAGVNGQWNLLNLFPYPLQIFT
jgi:hypothetical protein